MFWKKHVFAGKNVPFRAIWVKVKHYIEYLFIYYRYGD